MIAWTGIEHFVVGRFEDPPADDEPDDMQVCCLQLGLHLFLAKVCVVTSEVKLVCTSFSSIIYSGWLEQALMFLLLCLFLTV